MTGLGRPVLWWLPGWILGLSLCLVPSAQAQFGFNGLRQSTDEESLFRRLPREPRTLGILAQVASLIEAGSYQEAIDLLQPVLESTEDFFDLDQKQSPVGSILDRVESLLRSLPPEAIETYRRQFEPQAEQLLKDARKSGELNQFLEIARLFPITQSAQVALREGATIAQDHGESAVAARLRERILPDIPEGAERTSLLIEIARDWTIAGQPELAQVYVKELSALARTSPLEFEGKLLTPPESADAAWLNKVFGPVVPLVPQRSADWRVSGGHPRRWADGQMVSPVQRGSWSYPLIDRYDTRHYEDMPHKEDLPAAPPVTQKRHEKMLSLLKALETKFLVNKTLDTQTPVLVGSPVVDRGTVLVQGLGTVKALDLQTGQLRWSGVVEDNTFLYCVYRCFLEDNSQAGFMDLFLGQRTWLNQTATSLASDGQRVYSISGTGIFGLTQRNPFNPGRNAMPRGELSPANENRLLAYDIQTGLLKWELGGVAVSEPVNPLGEVDSNSRLTGAYFLGAPLAVEGRLYVMAEDRGQMRLFSLIPESGAVEWSLALVNPDDSIDSDEGRRISGLTPSYAGGLLVCPTGEGVVVTVDPLRRRVKWIHQYRGQTLINPRAQWGRAGRDRFGRENRKLEQQLRERRWFDSTVLLTAGRALVPAADHHLLICLELETGKPVWTLPRGDGLFLAACTGRQCLVVGERTIQSIRLSDGKTAWSREIPTPAGRGVVVGGKYLLPASNGEILAIEITSGRIHSRFTLDPSHTAGTLIAAGDQLLMQTASELVGFRSLHAVKSELASQAQEPAMRPRALAEQGELLLAQGKEDEAISMLRESLQLQDAETTRKLLVWSLLDRLKIDFAGNRKLVPELKQMTHDSGQRKLLTRLNAEGMEQAGEYAGAFQEYLQLVLEVGSVDESQIEISPDLHVREDRWLRGRLTHLIQLADPQLRGRMQDLTRAAWTGLDGSARKQFASVVGLELAPELYLDLALSGELEDFQGKGDFLSKRVLWTLSESTDLKLRGPAVARLVRDDLKRDLAQKSLVSTLIPQFDHELADVLCEPGLTGTAFLKSLRDDAKLGASLAAIAVPGVPHVESVRDPVNSTVMIQRDLLPVLGPRKGVFDEWLFSMERSSSGTVWFSDPMGRDRFSIVPQSIGVTNDHTVRYVQTDAQLALLVFRDSFSVVYPLEPGNQSRYMGQLNAFPGFNERFGRDPDPKPGVRDKIYTTRGGTMLGNVGPLLFDTLVYQVHDGRDVGDLVAVVPTTRKEVWRRTGLQIGCEILADADYVVLVPFNEKRMIVLRTSDGVQVAERPLPSRLVDRKRAEWGRLFLSNPEVPPAGDPLKTSYVMYDPVTDRPVWSRTVPKETLWVPVNGEDLAFLEPSGRITLVDDQTGTELWVSQLPAQTAPIQQLQIHADHERIYLHTWHEPTTGQEPVRIDPSVRIAMSAQICPVNGLVAALDRRSGQIVWSQTIEQQLFRESMPVGTGLLAYSATRQKLGGKPFQNEYSLIELLDRQTGKAVFRQDLVPNTIDTSWKLLHTGVLRVRLAGHEMDLSWKRPEGTPEQSEPVTEPEMPNPDAPIKLQ
jgi:outer membrane protein assembly factor BamB